MSSEAGRASLDHRGSCTGTEPHTIQPTSCSSRSSRASSSLAQSKTFLIAHLNVRSLVRHFSDVIDLLSINNFDVFTISETWITSNDNVGSFTIPGYSFVHAARSSQHAQRGGGVGIYVKANINFTLLCDSIPSHYNCDSLMDVAGISARLSCGQFAIFSIYRSPKCTLTAVDSLEEFIRDISVQTDAIICAGDLNINVLNANDAGITVLQRFMSSLTLKQIIDEPTRITDTSATLIDIILASHELRVKCLWYTGL